MISLPWPHKNLNPNSRVHWAQKSKQVKQHRMWAGTLATQEKVKSGVVVTLSFHFYPPDNRRRDLDNMLSMCKAYIDGISDALGLDDSEFRIMLQKEKPLKGGAVNIKIIT